MKTGTILIIVFSILIIGAILVFFYLKKKEQERLAQAQTQTQAGNVIGGVLQNAGGLLSLWNSISGLFGGTTPTNTATTVNTPPFYPTPTGQLKMLSTY